MTTLRDRPGKTATKRPLRIAPPPATAAESEPANLARAHTHLCRALWHIQALRPLLDTASADSVCVLGRLTHLSEQAKAVLDRDLAVAQGLVGGDAALLDSGSNRGQT